MNRNINHEKTKYERCMGIDIDRPRPEDVMQTTLKKSDSAPKATSKGSYELPPIFRLL